MGIQCEPSKMDVAMINIWRHLKKDFSSVLGFEICGSQEKALLNSVKQYRETPCGSFLNLPPYFAKCYIQLDKFLKRYRFANDQYTDDELSVKAVQSFHADNLRVASHRSVKESTYRVMQRARSIVKDAVGSFDATEHVNACRFGKNASVGSPFAKSYLDLKLCTGPLTGSTEHIQWFKNYVLPDDKILSGVLRRHRSEDLEQAYVVCSSLPQQFVPKAFDKLRGITPNTLLGSFHSYGLGIMLKDRLKENCGIDIATQQTLHAKLVKGASVNRQLVTGDLTSASQSITLWHVKKLFPRDWVKQLNFGRIRDVVVDGVTVQSATFAGMGIGFTFPLQTLVFYSILKAIVELSGKSGFVSVYGDDLIYPRSIHRYVVPIFEDLGFIFNVTKTFSKENFRESCGSDFYRGIDCRPVSPAGTNQGNSRNGYISDLYKLRNNLTRKWLDEEIRSTLHYIDRSIAATSGELLFVPPHFPDTAGIRLNTPHVDRSRFNICYSQPRYIVAKQSWAFRYMAASSPLRPVLGSDPYFWDTLRSKSVGEQEHVAEPWDVASTSSLRWVQCKKSWKSLTKADLVHSKLHAGMMYKKMTACCQEKGRVSYRPSEGFLHTWSYTGEPRVPQYLESRIWLPPERWLSVNWMNVSSDKASLTRGLIPKR